MRILFVSANPGSTEKLDLADELRNFQQSLKGHNVSMTLLPAAQPDDLRAAVETNDYDVIHFSGHAKDEGILMRNIAGNEELVDGDLLRDLFAKSDKTRLAFLNACDTETVAEKLEQTVGMVIGTKTKLNDDVAKAMTDLFYTALGKGSSLVDAYKDATSQIEQYFPAEENVYKTFGKKQEEILLDGEKSEQQGVTLEGLPTWDKHYHVAHLDEQISSQNAQIKLDQKVLGGLLLAGVILFALLIYIGDPNWKTLFPFFTASDGFPFITKEGREMLIGKTPLLEWLATLGAGIPVAIAAFKNRFLISGNHNLIMLRQLRSMVRSSDQMSPETRKKLHNIMEQSVLGANSS